MTDYWQDLVTMTREQLAAERDVARKVGEHNGRLRALRSQREGIEFALLVSGDTTVTP